MPYKNPNKQKEYQRLYRESHKQKAVPAEKRREYWKRWYESNKADYAKKRKLTPSYNKNTSEISRRSRSKRRQLLDAIKMHYCCSNPKCQWSGEYHPTILDFHHTDENKDFCVTRKVGKKKLFAEINKCCVLCSNCHRLATWTELDCSTFPKCKVNEFGEIITG